MNLRRRLILALLLGAAPAGACSCDEDTILGPGPVGSCEPDAVCEQGYAYRLGACRVARCQDDLDCCPGQRCSAAAGLCVDQWLACSDDTECGERPGQRCIPFRDGTYCAYPNRDRSPTAVGTERCEAADDCPVGTACVGHRCVGGAPCEGGCPDGQVCDIDSNTCFTLDTCELACEPGQIRVVEDPDLMSGPQCCEVACACATLPPVAPGQYGWHASLVADGQRVWVGAYDARYGDLVVAEFDREGAPLGVDYVDGFPTEGPLVADPTGARGGREAPGPDVGEYASAALGGSGDLHLAYHDRDAGRLKYARRTGDTWSTHVVDDSGDVGRFTAIALDPSGSPRIAYMAVAVDGPSGPRSGLRLARASSPTPSGGQEWTVTEIDAVDVPDPVCQGGCEQGEACVDFGDGPGCRAESSGCSEACEPEQVCVDGPGGPTCATEIPAVGLDDLPAGTGLFASHLVGPDGRSVIAYYDRLGGRLRLATEDESGAFSVVTLDGEAPDRDVGAHVSLARAEDGRIGLTYMDFTDDDLVYLEPGSGLREVIDDGVSPPDLRMVGADASLVFDASGAPAVAYQDGTRLDLLYARRIDGAWSVEVLRGAPPSGDAPGAAAGFYATQARVGSQAWVGSVGVGFDAESNLLLELTVDRRPLD